MRKHFTQMNQTEKAFVHGFIRSKAHLVLNSHLAHFHDRATDRHFAIQDIVEALKGGLVVEVHNDAKHDVRALVRNQAGTCVVISLLTMQAITVYYNSPDDKHDTINWAPYRWQQDISELIKSIRKAA